MDSIIIAAPDNWNDYTAGLHLRGETERLAGNDIVAWLRLEDQSDQSKDRLEHLEDAPHDGDWRSIETAAITGSISDRLTRLNSLAQKRIEIPKNAKAQEWEDIVAQGRLHFLVAENTLKEKAPGASRKVEAQLDEANYWYSKVVGGDFLRATTEVLRGKNRAWRNDVPGATACLSFALGVFRTSGHALKEAEASYELAMANLDAGNGAAAISLLNTSVTAYDKLPRKTLSLTRAKQTRARAALSELKKHSDRQPLNEHNADMIGQLEKQAENDAIDAYVATSSESHTPELLNLLNKDAGAKTNAGKTLDAFRAAMAARDLSQLELHKYYNSKHAHPGALEKAKIWWKAACVEANYSRVIDRGGTPTLRTEFEVTGGASFQLCRLSQLEFELLAATAPAEAGPLLVEVGKRFWQRSELNYTIECFLAAAAAFRRAGKMHKSAKQQLAEAEHWTYRAQRIATTIGYELPSIVSDNTVTTSALIKQLDMAIENANAKILRQNWHTENVLSADIVLQGRSSISELLILSKKITTDLNMPILESLSDRGDIPQIREVYSLGDGQTAIVQEKPLGVSVSQIIGTPHQDLPVARIAARLCRSIAGLMHAHWNESGEFHPLFITPEDLQLIPGNRCIISKFGPLGGQTAVPIGWAFLYAAKSPETMAALPGIDAVALARMLLLLLMPQEQNFKNLRSRSFFRRAFLLRRKEIDNLPLELVKSLGELARGEFVSTNKSEIVGYAQLIGLARQFDIVAQMEKN